MRDVKHAIDFVPGSSLLNLPTNEHKILQETVDNLLKKTFIQESKSLYTVPALLVPKKDGTMRMCVDSRTINKIIAKYRFPIPRLENILDKLQGVQFFSRLT